MNQSIRSSKREPTSISLVNHKDDEKLLSESLYRNLHEIQRFHNPTPDFLSIYEQAFLHVFHLIFICLDAAEFNKRFLWPIYDKTSESRFRNSTLDYLNHLNTIHQLGFETLKLHNIHIPGGLKFIKIVHKVLVLAMKITLNRNTKTIPNVNDIPDANEQLAKLGEAVDEGLDFVALQAQSNLVRERTDDMERTMMSFFQDSTINVTKEECWSCLLYQWRNQLDHVVENDLKPKVEHVAVVSKNCVDFEQLLTKLFVDRKENVIEYDKAKLVVAQNVLMKWNPDLEQAIAGMIENNFINFDHLLQVFQFVLPRIMEKIEKFEFRDLDAIEYESNQIEILDARVSQVQNQCSAFEIEIQPFLKKEEKRFRRFCLNVPNLPFQIMQTPVVARKIDAARRRFFLMDDNPTRTKLFNETLPSHSRTINKHQNLNATFATGSNECSMQSSKARSDAMQILLKNRSSRGNTTQSFRNLSCLNEVRSPKFSSTMCSTAVKNHGNKYLGDELKVSPVFPESQPTRTIAKNIMENASLLSPNSTVQRKFSTNSVHRLSHTDLRLSPTRRWEVNDNIATVHQNFVAPTSVNGNHHHEAEKDVENLISTLSEIRIDEDEFLGNISDKILNNVTN